MSLAPVGSINSVLDLIAFEILVIVLLVWKATFKQNLELVHWFYQESSYLIAAVSD